MPLTLPRGFRNAVARDYLDATLMSLKLSPDEIYTALERLRKVPSLKDVGLRPLMTVYGQLYAIEIVGKEIVTQAPTSLPIETWEEGTNLRQEFAEQYYRSLSEQAGYRFQNFWGSFDDDIIFFNASAKIELNKDVDIKVTMSRSQS